MNGLLQCGHICKIIDDCIKDLREGKSTKLGDLAALLHSLAVATNNEVFTALFPTFFSFSSALIEYQSSILLAPMLPSEDKSKYRTIFEGVTKQGIDALTKLKNELSKTEPDCKEIVSVLALLIQGWRTLSEEMVPFRIPRQRG